MVLACASTVCLWCAVCVRCCTQSPIHAAWSLYSRPPEPTVARTYSMPILTEAKEVKMSPSYQRLHLALSVLVLVLAVVAVIPVQAASGVYTQHNLVADVPNVADHTDTDLVNAWGIAFNPTAFVWIADNGSGKSTLYDGAGNKQSLVVTIPGGSPTGIVFNGSADFKAPNTVDATKNPSRFIFATENGVIAAWAPPPNPPVPMAAVTMVSNASAVYKGLALAANGQARFLYATNFSQGTVDVFDTSFTHVTLAGSFSDPRLPSGFAPFGIQNIQGALYVTYAKQDAAKHDDVPGPGLGFVNVFDPDGHLLQRVASRGTLNSPWGLALAPAGFGRFSNRLLVGNFGDGRINAFDVATGRFVGQIRGTDGHPLRIDGLWGLSFGNGVLSQPTDALFFTAGPADEGHGLYGYLKPAPNHRDDEDGD